MYRLPQLIAQPQKPIIFTGGERKAEVAAELFPENEATTTNGGYKAPENADLTPLAGCRITIWPDNGEPGDGYPPSRARGERKRANQIQGPQLSREFCDRPIRNFTENS